jgi:hypothetical protein
VTLELDVERLVRALMHDQGLTFKQAVNQAIQLGLAGPMRRRPARTPTFAMGFDPAIPWDKALRLAAQMEDEELTRRLSAGA